MFVLTALTTFIGWKLKSKTPYEHNAFLPQTPFELLTPFTRLLQRFTRSYAEACLFGDLSSLFAMFSHKRKMPGRAT